MACSSSAIYLFSCARAFDLLLMLYYVITKSRLLNWPNNPASDPPCSVDLGPIHHNVDGISRIVASILFSSGHTITPTTTCKWMRHSLTIPIHWTAARVSSSSHCSAGQPGWVLPSPLHLKSGRTIGYVALCPTLVSQRVACAVGWRF